MRGEGGKERKLGAVGRAPQMRSVRVPLPTPSQPGVGSLSIAVVCPQAVHLIQGVHCPNGWQHKPGRPNTCPPPASQTDGQGPVWPPEHTALPSLLSPPCTAAMDMVC